MFRLGLGFIRYSNFSEIVWAYQKTSNLCQLFKKQDQFWQEQFEKTKDALQFIHSCLIEIVICLYGRSGISSKYPFLGIILNIAALLSLLFPSLFLYFPDLNEKKGIENSLSVWKGSVTLKRVALSNVIWTMFHASHWLTGKKEGKSSNERHETYFEWHLMVPQVSM